MTKNKVIILVIFQGVLKIHLISEMVVHGSLCYSHQKGRVVNQLLLCFLLFCSFQSVVPCVVSSLGLVTEVMYIPASPGFWKVFPMILE